MTIAAAYLVSEGVVLGADSSSSVMIQTPQGPGVGQVLRHAQKLFEVGKIGKASRMGLCTWGAGGFREVSHRTLFARLSDWMKEDTSIEQASRHLAKLVQEVKGEGVGYYLGGWDPGFHQPACYKIELSKDKELVEPLKMGMCSFSGQPQFFMRVFHGYDPVLIERLREGIKDRLPDGEIKNNFGGYFNEAFGDLKGMFVNKGYQDLPIREAIDFVYSYLHITVKALKFMFGAPTCGGPIEVAFISTDRSFRWVRHKSFGSAMLEEEGEYDVKR